jgi:hypothetical protein
MSKNTKIVLILAAVAVVLYLLFKPRTTATPVGVSTNPLASLYPGSSASGDIAVVSNVASAIGNLFKPTSVAASSNSSESLAETVALSPSLTATDDSNDTGLSSSDISALLGGGITVSPLDVASTDAGDDEQAVNDAMYI